MIGDVDPFGSYCMYCGEYCGDDECGCVNDDDEQVLSRGEMLKSMANMLVMWTEALNDPIEEITSGSWNAGVRASLIAQLEKTQVCVMFASVCGDRLGAPSCNVEFPLTKAMVNLSASLLKDRDAIKKASGHLEAARYRAKEWRNKVEKWQVAGRG